MIAGLGELQSLYENEIIFNEFLQRKYQRTRSIVEEEFRVSDDMIRARDKFEMLIRENHRLC